MHRVGQFFGHLTARADPAGTAFAHDLLPRQGWPLFDAMPAADRRHALRVAHRLLDAGHDDRELLAAALLHDVGKGRRMRLWHRVAGVLLERLAPRFLARLASPDPRSLGHGFHLYLHHAELSAEAVRDAGLGSRTVALIAGTDPADAATAVLRAADDAA